MRLSNQAVLAASKRYLDLIGGKPMNEAEMHAFIGETVESYEKHVNRGFISYRKSVLGALGEVADALKAYSTSAQAMELQAQRVTASLEVQRLAEMRFGAGTTSFVEVLDAQRQLLSAQTDSVQSLLDRRLALVRLYLALGGGWAAQQQN